MITLKRIFDVLFALIGLAVLSPVIAIACLAVRATLGRPVLFRQLRGGLGNRPFVFIKLRTMSTEVGIDGNLLSDAQRISSTGQFLRSTSIDELPQLWNVLTGDMSLVGPRPLLASYLHRYTTKQRERHNMRPGITGWAQVQGRNALSWEQKFEYDLWYVRNWSFWLDCRIMIRTVWQVLKREGIASKDHATMPEFQGAKAGPANGSGN